MTAEFGDLIGLSEVSLCGDGTFLGQTQRTGQNRVFGGQLLAQIIRAVAASAPGFAWPASLHTYFIAAPIPDRPVRYTVTVRRDGGAHAWRHVLADQDGKHVLEAIAVFRAHAPAPVELPPPTSRPESLPCLEEEIQRSGEGVRKYYVQTGEPTADVRFVRGSPPLRLASGDRTPQQELWMRPYRSVAGPPHVVAAALAYLSDVSLLSVPLMAVGRLGDGTDGMGASFDHTLRFYGLPASLEWTYHEHWASVASAAQAEASGRIMTAEGYLLATMTQQGLIHRTAPASTDIGRPS